MRSDASSTTGSPDRLRHIASAAVLILLAALHIACSSRAIVYEDPYANCVNLGDLSALSSTRLEAEEAMRARVLELGGDTLLIAELGRPERLDDLPEEIVVRREELLTAESNVGQPVVGTASSDETDDIGDDANELASAEPSDGQPRAPRIVWEEAPGAQGESWYYGAALRCNVTE